MVLPTVAILDDPSALEVELESFEHADVVWAGQSVDVMMDVLPVLRPRILVLRLVHLGRAPITRARLLTTLAQADLTLVTYRFASPELLGALRDEDVWPVQAPLTPEALYAQMSRVVIRSPRTGAPIMVGGRSVPHLSLVRASESGVFCA